MFRRIIGILLTVIAIGGIILSVVGYRAVGSFIDDIGVSFSDNLDLLSDSLSAVEDTLVLTKSTVSDATASFDTLNTTAVDMSDALQETQPLLNQVGTIASNQIPASIEAVQETIPDVAQVAGIIDDTLATLNNFQINQSILGIDFNYDLGINYDPDVPFDVSVQRLGNSLDGLPEELRQLDGFVTTTNDNLTVLSQDILQLSQDLEQVQGNLSQTPQLIDEYIRIVNQIEDNIRQTKNSLNQQLEQAKFGLSLLFVWIGLTQLAPLYLGLELLFGRRQPQPSLANDT